MFWFILGLVLLFFVHGFKAFFPNTRQKISDKMGADKSKGPFALGILASFALIVVGWRSIIPSEFLYFPPYYLRHVTYLLMVISLYLLVNSTMPIRIRRWIRHPQLMAVGIWSIAHLLSNGELRAVLLFGSVGLWAFILMPFINRRDGEYTPPTPKGIGKEFQAIGHAIVATGLVMALHGFFTAIPLISW